MSGMNNELAPNITMVQIGTQAASINLPGPVFRKHAKLIAVSYINQALLAADNTNYLQLSLQIGSTVLATLDTRAAHEGALAALVATALTIASSDIPAASQLKVVVTKNGTGVPTLGQLQLEWFPY